MNAAGFSTGKCYSKVKAVVQIPSDTTWYKPTSIRNAFSQTNLTNKCVSGCRCNYERMSKLKTFKSFKTHAGRAEAMAKQAKCFEILTGTTIRMLNAYCTTSEDELPKKWCL